MLHTFLREQRFNERYVADQAAASGPPEGTVVIRSCPTCGQHKRARSSAGRRSSNRARAARRRGARHDEP